MAGTIALYLRISQDDDNRDESNSVANQRGLLRAYIGADPTLAACEVLEYSDDGWSGTNFDRPRVRELLDVARKGGVQCIVVKDLSRWGRNYIEVSEYIEQIFPFLGVRFISVNDHYDSNDYRGATAPIDVAFRSLVHDIYSRELSVKISQSYEVKAKRGEYVCGHPPFGYMRSETEKNHLVADDGAAAIIRRIFSLACDGLSGVQIAAALNEDGVDSPLIWRKRNGRTMLGMTADPAGVYWGAPQIVKIIRDERYTGTLVCFKSKRVKIGGRKAVRIPESEWLRVPDAHPAIISDEQFAMANERLRKNNRRSGKHTGANRAPLQGVLIQCGHCNKVMRWMQCKAPYYYCEGPKLKKGKGCFEGRVSAELLREIILATVKTEAQKVYDERLRRRQTIKRDSSDRESKAAERKRLMAQTVFLERRADALYEEYAEGKLDRDGYLTAKAAHSGELSRARERLAALAVHTEDAAGSAEIPIDEPLLRRILDADDVTGEVMSLIDRVIVYDPRRIEIRFAFGDAMEGVLPVFTSMAER